MLQKKHEVDRGQLWVYPKRDDAAKTKIIHEFHLHPVIAQVLVSRKMTDSKEIHNYLYSRLPDLYDPFLFEEMQQAVDRITKAIQSDEHILVYGDNDVDGMTGTALLTEFLHFVGAKVHHYVSNRAALLRQSMILDALEYALCHHCTLLITVDCGITAGEHIKEVVKQGVDVIITDHHEPTAKIPNCVATLNPKLVTSVYPNRELTGVGVAFKLAHALTTHLIDEGLLAPKKVDLKRYLDLVAMGTVSDMGILLGENRILVSYGLEQLKKTKRVGLAKLLSVCETEIAESTTAVIASKIAPRLNSLGRIAEPEQGVNLLLTRNPLIAEKLAVELNLYNMERQKIERAMVKDVEKIINDHPELLAHRAIVLSSHKWHPGIIAIIAMRIAKQYNRPCVIFSIDGQIGKGSIRSIAEFPVLPILKQLSDMLINFGGHDQAAGLTIRENLIPEFTKKFVALADEKLQEAHIAPKLYLDAEVPFTELTFDLIESMKLLEPYGNGNQPPLFYTEVEQTQCPKIIGRQHLRLFLEQKGRFIEGIALNAAARQNELFQIREPIKIAFTPQVNGSSIQLLIRDFRVASKQPV